MHLPKPSVSFLASFMEYLERDKKVVSYCISIWVLKSGVQELRIGIVIVATLNCIFVTDTIAPHTPNQRTEAIPKTYRSNTVDMIK